MVREEEKLLVAEPSSVAVVGMGASAGGLEALATFFDHVPAETGMAFVVVMHQHPWELGRMPDFLARHSRMPVAEVEEGMSVVADRIYVAPPGFTLEIAKGHLHLVRPAEGAAHATIDHFFRSLALDQKRRAIGVILSGAGSDGRLGLEEIRAAAGLVLVQDEGSASAAGMPDRAVATAPVDHVVPIENCADQLLAYVRGPFYAAENRPGEQRAWEAAIEHVLVLLRAHTGNDFSRYKESTLRRRIERRMNVHDIAAVDDYVQLLQQNTAELHALFRELLVGVTSFFRDPDAFATLASSLDRLLAERKEEDGIRAWVAGCATGEEAYSTAILLLESAERLQRSFTIQVFATDLDSGAIEAARFALFPDGISADVSSARLERFFTREERGYRVSKEVRDLIVFAPHNLLKHPPFTRVDLIVCRNVLIYLNSDAQASVLPLFHHALRPRGILFLGPSESLGRFGDLFESIDPRWKLFARLEPPVGAAIGQPLGQLGHVFSSPGQLGQLAVNSNAGGPAPGHLVDRLLLEQLVPPSVLVNEHGEIVHVHGKTDRFLEATSEGAPVGTNMLQLARPGLELHLATAIREAAASGDARRQRVRVQTGADPVSVDVRAFRVESPEPLRGLILVSFETAGEEPTSKGEESSSSGMATDGDVAATLPILELRAELDRARRKCAKLEQAVADLQRAALAKSRPES